MFSLSMLIIVNIVFVLSYLQVEPVFYLRVANKPIQITSCVINIGNSSTILVKSAAQMSTCLQ